MDDRKYYRTRITVSVLSEKPQAADLPLEDVAYMINEGDCVGQVTQSESKEMTAKNMARSLYRYGSEPGFFRLNDDGTHNTDELDEEDQG